MKRDLIFEAGTEEMPAKAVNEGIAYFNKRVPEMFGAARLALDSFDVYGSPRRLALLVHGLSEWQNSLVEEIKGPPAKIATESDGSFTKAALGFAKAQNVDTDHLAIRDVGEGSYLFAVVERSGEKAIDLLPDILKDLIVGVNFSKSMRWGRSQMRFSRPIRWITTVFGSEEVAINIDSVQVSRNSYGHRFLHPEPINIENPSDYLELLRSGFAIADQSERKKIIESGIDALAKREKCKSMDPSNVIDEVVHLVEWPTPVMGSFDSSFLGVPKEVLVTAMQSHQRYFPMENHDGSLAPSFITVHNGDPQFSAAIASGNERVLTARLSDAKFFYDEDRKRGLDAMREGLRNVVFLEGLGTLFDKSQRLKDITVEIVEMFNFAADAGEKAARAAELCKADLLSDVVIEFPELQGTMGKIYSQIEGEDPEVSKAINEHYLPRFSGDSLPETKSGIVLSVADKLDNITGMIFAGLPPSGSEDPYALRRQALGIINILIRNEISVDLSILIKKAISGYGSDESGSRQALVKELFDGRMRQLLSESFRYDLIDAVMELGSTNYFDIFVRAQALKASLESSQLSELFVAFERCRNLSKNAKDGEIDPELIEKGAERELFDIFRRVFETIDVPLSEGNYTECLILLSSLKKPVDRYFDDVLIMVEDLRLRENRLRLLRDISMLFEKMARFDKIVEVQERKD